MEPPIWLFPIVAGLPPVPGTTTETYIVAVEVSPKAFVVVIVTRYLSVFGTGTKYVPSAFVRVDPTSTLVEEYT